MPKLVLLPKHELFCILRSYCIIHFLNYVYLCPPCQRTQASYMNIYSRLLSLSHITLPPAEPSPELVRERVGGMRVKVGVQGRLLHPPLQRPSRKLATAGAEQTEEKHPHWGSWSNVPCPEGRYVTLRARDS